MLILTILAFGCSSASQQQSTRESTPSRTSDVRVVPEGSLFRPQTARMWWCTHSPSQRASELCVDSREDCEAKREFFLKLPTNEAPAGRADWTPCREQTSAYCHKVTDRSRRSQLVCFETEPACTLSAKATAAAAGACFKMGS